MQDANYTLNSDEIPNSNLRVLRIFVSESE